MSSFLTYWVFPVIATEMTCHSLSNLLRKIRLLPIDYSNEIIVETKAILYIKGIYIVNGHEFLIETEEFYMLQIGCEGLAHL